MTTTYHNTGWKNPGSALFNKFGENYRATLLSPDNIKQLDTNGAYTNNAVDGVRADRRTGYLIGYNYNFGIPADAYVVGVDIRIFRRRTTVGSATAKDYHIGLRNGSLSSHGRIGSNMAKSSIWETSFTVSDYGGSKNLCGANLTPAIVNNTNFGVVLQAVGASASVYAGVSIGAMQLRIHYALIPDSGSNPIPDPEPPSGGGSDIGAGINVTEFKEFQNATQTSSGKSSWVNPDNARVDDSVYATSTITANDGLTEDLRLTNAGFSVLHRVNRFGLNVRTGTDELQNTNGFTTWGSSTISSSTEWASKGDRSLKGVTTNSASDQGISTSPVNVRPNIIHNARLVVMSNVNQTVKFGLRELNSSDTTIDTTVKEIVLEANVPQRISIDRTFGATGERARIYVITKTAINSIIYADEFYLDDYPLIKGIEVEIERKTNTNDGGGTTTNTGVKNPGSWADHGGGEGGFYNWAVIERVATLNDSGARADTTSANATTPKLNVSNFNLNIPSNAIINGVEVIIRHSQSGTATNRKEHTLYLTSGSSVISGCQNKANSSYTIPQSYATYTRGGNTDTWGCNLTPTIVNNSNFGVSYQMRDTSGLSGSLYVDVIQIKVYYSTPAGIVDNKVQLMHNGSNIGTAKANAIHIGTNDTKIRYGGENDNWGVSNLTPEQVAHSTFGVSYQIKNGNSSSYIASVDYIKMRVFFEGDPPINGVLPIKSVEIDDTLVSTISQADTSYTVNILPMSIERRKGLINRPLGYIGMVMLDRGHHYSKVDRTNKLNTETKYGTMNWNKSGEIEEKKPLEINVQNKWLKTLEGLVDLEAIVPINTVLTLSDNEPYLHRGYGIIEHLNYERINHLRSVIDLDITYLTKDLFTPLFVDYERKNIPPLDFQVYSNYQNALFDMKSDTIKNIDNFNTLSADGTRTIVKNNDNVSITITPVNPGVTSSNVRYISINTIQGECKTYMRIIHPKMGNNTTYPMINIRRVSDNAEYARLVTNPLGTTGSFITYNRDDVVANTQTVTFTGIDSSYTDYTLIVDIDKNNKGKGTFIISNGTDTKTFTINNVDLGIPKSYKPSLWFHNYSAPETTYILKEYGASKQLYTNDINNSIRNIIHTPEAEYSNIDKSFQRSSFDGKIDCYINPERDIIYNIDPSHFFNTSVKLSDQNNIHIINKDTVISKSTNEITLENGLLKIIFDLTTKKIKLFGFYLDWYPIVELTNNKMNHIKIDTIRFDKIVLIAGETKWTLERGKYYCRVEHEYDTLTFNRFDKYWHDTGGGLGVEKSTISDLEAIPINQIFYTLLYNNSGDMGLQVFRPYNEDITTSSLPPSKETGLGLYFKIADTPHNEHQNIALEYLARSNQDIYIDL